MRPADVVLPLLIGLAGIVELAGAGEQAWPLGVACLLASCVALSVVRAFPVAVPPVIGMLYLLAALGGFDVSEPAVWLAPLPLAAFLAGLHAPRERVLAGLGAVTALLALSFATLAFATDFEPNVVFGLVGALGPWALGVALREARERVELAAAGLERERLDGVAAIERAATDERERIAGELHDVLAHTIGEMVVRTAVADDQLARDPAAAARALGEVARTGRAALGETGRLLRLLRDEADELGLVEVAPTAPAEPSRTGTVGPRDRADLGLGRGDVLLPLAFAVAGCAEIALDASLAPTWLWVAACLGAAVALLGRRRWPAATPPLVAVLLALPMGISAADDDPAAWILALGLACFGAGRRVQPSRRGLGAVAATWAIVVAAGELGGAPSLEDAVLSGVLVLGSWAAGVAQARALARARAAGVAQERERARALRQVESAAAAERRRVARELHDVLASSLGVMIVQASLAEELALTDPAAARVAVAAVEDAGRRTLEDLGALLRLSGDALPAEGIAPRRGIADIATLAEEFGRAGLPVEVALQAGDRPLPAGVELSTYRIVQEALTNVLKHAPGSGAAVRLDCDGAVVAIEVSNGPATAGTLGVESGHGLIGLRERVAHHGGALTAGPTPDGGYQLSATLPTALEAA